MKEKRSRKKQQGAEGKDEQEGKRRAKAIQQPKEKRNFIGSLVNADLWHRMRMLSLKERKPAGRLLDMAMQEFLDRQETKKENSQLQ